MHPRVVRDARAGARRGLDGLMLGGETSADDPRRIGASPSSSAAAERSNSLATAPRTRVRSRACPRRGWRASAPPSGRDRPCPTERRRASERRRRRMANNDWTSEDPRPSRGRRRPARGPTTAHAAWRRRRRDTSKHERNTAPSMTPSANDPLLDPGDVDSPGISRVPLRARRLVTSAGRWVCTSRRPRRSAGWEARRARRG